MPPRPETDPGMRAQISASWHRSAAHGVQVELAEAPITLPDDQLRAARDLHPLARVLPLLEDVLGPAVRGCDAVLAVGDADGQLLWVSGSSAAMGRAERIGFVPGSNWDERVTGTNAPGTALALGETVSVDQREHFRESVRGWSCVATPIHDPRTSQVLGVLDVTGGGSLIVPQTVAMIRAAARMAESELAGAAPAALPPQVRTGSVQLEALGRDEAILRGVDGRAVRLGARHSEIVVLLAAHPEGLTGEELATLVYPDDVRPATVRAELNRLRAVLGDDMVGSRPYRLLPSVSADWYAVAALLSAGDVEGALRGYRGRLLLRSQSPGVADLADELEWSLRAAVLASGRADLMAAWTRTAAGADDLEAWQAQAAALPARSPLHPMVAAQVARLDAALRAP
ncbi:helix-turn-helix domain-containing protein [Barrientosiimonas endolithica]|uniref:Transcriptional regulator n=1 Tax=Barrientosiimonas endolithica TaxID=1535208 RepID=A0ABM8H6R9_9MICO|nr:helix-turn-helix domain-containing protein [Barrientosiimonas endolithica]BDZ56472.1 transcriptional regulator [Barrientosiimonas endolithica]